jgi:hypothetical protein
VVFEIDEDLALASESVWNSVPVVDVDLDEVKVIFCRKNVYLDIQAKHIEHELVRSDN